MSWSTRQLAALALLLAWAGPARALDVKLWPLFRYARDDAHGELRWSALGPFIEYAETPEWRDLRIRPFFGIHQRRGPIPDDSADICYPLASSRWTPDEQSFRFLLFTYHMKTARPAAPPPPPAEAPTPGGELGPDAAPVPDAEPDSPRATAPPDGYASRLTVFPFVFYRHDAETGSHLSVFPFWLDLDDFLGWDHVRAVMFPAYLALSEPQVERRYYPFPFVSTVGGPDGDGVRVWPFYGWTEIAGREHSHFVLWPFHVRSEVLVPGYGWERRRVNFPAWAAIDGDARTSRAWGVVAYTHTVDRVLDTDVTGSPWPFVVRAKHIGADEYYTWRLTPIYGRSDRDGISSRFWLWPAYRVKRQDADDFHYTRRDAFFFLWRHQTLDSGDSGRTERLDTLFPLYRDEDESGRRFGQTPAVFDSLMPENRGVLSLWAPLWALVRWDTRPTAIAGGPRDWNVLYGLAARENGRLLGPWHLALHDGD